MADAVDRYIDEEVVPFTETTPGNEPINEAIDEETGVDKVAGQIVEGLGLMDAETKTNAKVLKAMAVRNLQYKKALAAQKAKKIVTWVLYVIVGLVVIGAVYLIYKFATKGVAGVREGIRKIGGHKNGFK